jgi:hypothetical protein
MNSCTRRYKKLLRQVARELDEKPDAEVVKHVATLRLMRENVQIRLLEGERVDAADVLRLDEALKQYLPQGKPLSVQVTIVNGTRVCCPGCKLEFDPHTDEPVRPQPDPVPPAPKLLPPPTIDAKPEQAAKKPEAPPRRDPGSIHNCVLPDGTPARMPPIDESWRTHVGNSGGYDVFQPAPDCGAAHVLPTPPPECFGK